MRKVSSWLLILFLAAIQLSAQNITLTGKVTDDAGIPLSGATILAVGTGRAANSNAEGNFTITVRNNVKELEISFIGFAPQRVRITGSRTYIIKLSPGSTQSLEDVVVTGYGTPQRRKNLTAAISTVGAKDLENRPFTSPDEMLAGKVPGLIAPASTGQPGAAQNIRIRGISSVTAGNNPLYVVDGVIINSGDLSRATTTANALAGVNANDIEDVTVLKDAQATSLYGSRGANGVILITTKSGKAGKTKIRLDAEVGATKFADVPDNARFLNADEWLTLTEEGMKNAGLSQATIDANMAGFGKGSGVNTDWKNLVTRQGTQQQYNVSASGGEGKTTFFLSGGYFKQEASVIASDFTRYSATANIKHTENKLTFGLNLSGSNAIQHTPSNGGLFANPVGSTAFLLPTQNPYNSDGSLNISRTGNLGFTNAFNPLYIAENDKHDLNMTQIRGNVSGEYAIVKGLKLSEKYGVDVNFLNEYTFNNPFHGDGRTVSGAGAAADARLFNWISTTLLSYNAYADKSGNIKLDALVGYEAQKSKSLFLDARATTYPPTTALPLSTNAATVTNGKESASDYSFNAILSNASVGYKNRYVLSGSFRRDASSRFSEKNRYGNFWSIGGAWNVDQEEFFSTLNEYIDNLKIRASYGSTGNANISTTLNTLNYGWRQTFGYGSNYNGLPGGTFNSIGNDVLTWETNNQFDVGADVTILRNRVNLTFDYYKRVSTNLLFADPVSLTTGFSSVTRNIGSMQNSGVEFSINATPVKTKDFSWSLNFNISRNKNKITKLPGGKDILSGTFIFREGLDMQTFYGRVYVGVDPANGDPIFYKDSTHKATVNDRALALREPLVGKSASPKYTGGFSNTFVYKGISLSGDFIYNYGNYVTDAWAVYLVDGTQPSNGKYAINLRRWQKPGDITDVPKYVYGSTNTSSSFSSRFLQKGDFIRLRNITLGYNLNNSVLTSLHLNRVLNSFNLYVRGTNLWTKTYDKNLTIDPEAGTAGSSNLDVYYTKTVSIGLNLGF